MSKECILYPEQYWLIWKLSFLSLFSAIYAAHNKHYDLIYVPGGVFLTSTLYWYKPDYSWRRYLDMGFVKLAVSYNMYRAYRSQYTIQYYTLVFIAICFYPLGIYYYKKNDYWSSTYAHCMLHIFGNIANVVLYSGKIEPATYYLTNFSCSEI